MMAILLAFLPGQTLKAEIFKAGSYIIDMGVIPQTYANGLKPYGMVYDMVINKRVPLYWIIRPEKSLYDTDFTYNGKDYKAGSLVLPAIYVTGEIRTAIAAWRAEGVVIDGPTLTDFDAPVYNYISSFPNAVVDQQNVKLTEELFYNHTSIPKSYYQTGTPADITICSDVYALPHADPQNWSPEDIATYIAYTDSKAQNFLWQGCHSVGAVEAHSANIVAYSMLNFTADVTIRNTGEKDDKLEIKDNFPDINITTNVTFISKKYKFGNNVTINILPGGSLTISYIETIECGNGASFKNTETNETVACTDLNVGNPIAGLTIIKETADTGDGSNETVEKITELLTISEDMNYTKFKIEDDSAAANDPGYLNLFMLTTNGQIAWDKDIDYDFTNENSPPFQYDTSAGGHPIMQIASPLDDNSGTALDGGSQEIYIPRPDSAWRSTTTVAIWDPDNVNNTLNNNNPNKAAVVAFGRAFGDPANGVLVQQASHNANKGTEAQNVSSGRIYGNLLLQASIEKRPLVSIGATNNLFYGNTYEMNATVTRGTAPFDFKWSLSCDGNDSVGTFYVDGIASNIQNDVNESHVEFKPANITLEECILRVKVTDTCGRKNSATKILGITGYYPSIGYYNVTHAGEDFSTSGGIDPQYTLDPVNSLYTQISGKSFDVMLIALGIDKETLTSKSGSVILELINAEGVSNLDPKICAETDRFLSNETSKVTTVANGGHFNNSTTITASGISYPHARKNLGFRISYFEMPVQSGDTYSYGIPSSMTKTDLDAQFARCASACPSVPPSGWGCYECIAGSTLSDRKPQGYGKAVCARDNFTVRPASFDLDLTGTEPFIGGHNYPLQLNAVTINGNIDGQWYADDIPFEINASNIWDNDPTLPIEANITSSLDITGLTGCDPSVSDPETLDSGAIKFTSGVGTLADDTAILFNYNNVGDIDITAVENRWVASTLDMNKDQTDTSYDRNDCIVGSSSNTPDVNGKIGCVIMGEDTNVTFIPSKFVNTLSLENFRDGNFTYVANSEGADPKYGAKATITYTAVLDDNITKARNYTADCYANNIESTIRLINNTALGWEGTQERIWMYDANTTAPLKLTGSSDTVPHNFTYEYPQSHFSAGVAKEEMLFDFDRRKNTPDNPFRILYSDFNITDVHDLVDTVVIGSDFNRTAGNSNESNATFYYARAKSSKFFYDDEPGPAATTPISVVVYRDIGTSTFSLLFTPFKPTNEYDWYLSTAHTSADGNITLVTTNTSDGNVTTNPTISNGVDNTVQVTAISNIRPLVVDINLTGTDPWLIYNPDADEEPDPFYRVRFIGISGWAGHGDTGNVVDSNASIKKNRRLGW